ncbi:MAG: hypothetical protein GWN84_26020, partial [Gammaproteobacteria bacterium]|nr:hypothetical protein [Gammaproteobacteria bacterium]NIU07241.1 hypothetical protein [Gammaproteobacteria bacterium]NIV54044.1 hypothetical protein [Gammaproteobacteria bacterium]NIX88514.1 hypothetical protein [Gammaproteobacteria bacterium]
YAQTLLGIALVLAVFLGAVPGGVVAGWASPPDVGAQVSTVLCEDVHDCLEGHESS